MCPGCRIPFVLTLCVVVLVYSVYNSHHVEFDSDVVPLDIKIEFIRFDASANYVHKKFPGDVHEFTSIQSVDGKPGSMTEGFDLSARVHVWENFELFFWALS